MAYVDGFVTPVPKRRLAEYRRGARLAAKVWRDHGALEYREWVAGETVTFAYVAYRSRADRNRINKAAMKDKRLAAWMNPKKLPFDAKRMFWGGFKPLVAL